MKKKAVRLSLELAIIIIIILLFFVINDQIQQNKKCSFYFVEDGCEYAYQVENAYVDNDDFVIKGWFFELKSVRNQPREVNENYKFEVLLYDLKQDAENDYKDVKINRKGICPEITYEVRSDVNEYFKCQYDYSNCGFTAKIKKEMLDLDNTDYQVVFKLDKFWQYGIGSSAYIIDGKLEYSNPSERLQLNVSGTDLEEIVNEGIYVGGSIDNHICVYQYGWSLYWIADDYMAYSTDGKTYIEYMTDTTQFDKLPSDRTDNGWFLDNIRGVFEDYEITDQINAGEYRVSVIKIPSEYSVVRIVTGQYINDQWAWKAFIRPIYYFNKNKNIF